MVPWAGYLINVLCGQHSERGLPGFSVGLYREPRAGARGGGPGEPWGRGAERVSQGGSLHLKVETFKLSMQVYITCYAF